MANANRKTRSIFPTFFFMIVCLMVHFYGISTPWGSLAMGGFVPWKVKINDATR